MFLFTLAQSDGFSTFVYTFKTNDNSKNTQIYEKSNSHSHCCMQSQYHTGTRNKLQKVGKRSSSAGRLFFTTPQATEVAETVLLYQQPTGGWPKNINFFQTPDNKEKALEIKNDVNASTIDNGATTTEIIYLSRLYNATHDETYKEAAIRGLDYLFEAQYENGGWPQFYPRPKGYYVQITYNDNAMINVMNLLRDVSNGKSPFTYLPKSTRQKAQKAIDKGVECILKTQVKQHGKLTVWCAQHDRETFAPAKARAYELPSLSGAESANIVIYLMQLTNPSAEVIQSIESAVQWFKDSEIKGIKIESFINKDGKKDRRVAPCEDCKPMWARFYELETNRPFFCDRDGIKRYHLSEIGYERRNGYSWLNRSGENVYKEYAQWQKRIRK